MDTLESARPALVARPQVRRVLSEDLSAALLDGVTAYYATDIADVLRAALVVAVGDTATVVASGGLARTIRRLTAPTDRSVIALNWVDSPPEVAGSIDVAADVVAGRITTTWSWCARTRTERAVVELSHAWSDALVALAAQASVVSPLPTVLDESASVAVDLPGAISPDSVRRAIDAVTCRYPYLATGRRVVGGTAFAVRGAGTSLRCTRSDALHPDWTPMVQFELTRAGAARTRLAITANPRLVGDLPGLVRELRAELLGDPEHSPVAGY
ncbi:hypothetical protein JOD54_001715 [Actinokineospora baliensis]|uniref:hypothetical protein n=1 Tax=Actinokineospora baliensis TaxID=547056 RepID=UPI00195D504F|nr:hypothetical protein [Actinokineospora baliensis]MBM7771511.1 hypothetical protein [Actinokineospora baliensis]